MENNFALIDIGNTSIDIISVENNIEDTYYKFYKEEKRKIKEAIKSLNCKKIYVTSVNKKTEKFILRQTNNYNVRFLNRALMKEYLINNKYDIPNINILGSDLFCDLVALEKKVDSIIIDLGTANKILVIDKNKKFLGGILLPGINSYSKAITSTTDLNLENYINSDLPLLNYETNECVSSGSVNALSLMIIKVVEKIKEDYNLIDTEVIFTGGNTKYVLNALEKYGFKKYKVNLKLVLLGLAKIYNLKIEFGGRNEIKEN